MRQSVSPEILPPTQAAKLAGLHYVTGQGKGIARERVKDGFRYRGSDGKIVRDAETLARVRRLAIPPAWEHVWICPDPRGHLQATGRDVKGRKQYRYHADWRLVRDDHKFERMLEFGLALPAIRARVERDMGGEGLGRERVLATIVRLLDCTLIRVGNEEYARENGSYGLTTMRCRHLSVAGEAITFRFRGKSGKDHRISVRDRRAARIVARCAELPGQALFQYLDDEGEARSIDSGDVNEYLREISGKQFTAKDFRTWAATVLAGVVLAEMEIAEKVTEAKRNVVSAMRAVAERLGNTPTICRKSYVHPGVVDAYLAGEPLSFKKVRRATKYMNAAEHAVIAFLRELARAAKKKPSLEQALAKSVAAATRKTKAA